MEKMPHGEHRTPVQSRQLLRHTIHAENQVLWPNHGMIPSLYCEESALEKSKGLKSSFTHYWSAREYADDISIVEEVGDRIFASAYHE